MQHQLETIDGGDRSIADPADPADSADPAHLATIEIRVFGAFAVREQHGLLSLPSGHVSDLVKLLVVSNGRLLVDQVIDVFWRDIDLSLGRARLRNVLKRLRKVSTALVARSGDALTLTDQVDSDFARASRAADQALGCAASLADANRAVRLNSPALLPDDLYSDWASHARIAQRTRFVRLLDRQADLAEQAGELDVAVVALEAAQDADGAGVERVLLGYKLLKSVGRESAASALAARHDLCTR